MKITALNVFTTNLELEKVFYSKILGIKIIEKTINRFTLEIGWSKLTFIKSNEHINIITALIIRLSSTAKLSKNQL